MREAEAGKAKDAGTLAGLIEQHARLAGAEEAYIAVAPDLAADRRLNRTSQPTPLAERFAVRASIAYKGCWVRRTRTFAKDGGAAKADAWFDGVVRSLEAGKPIAAQLAREGEGASRRDADKLDGRKLHRQLSAVGRRLVARAGKGRAGERPVPRADGRADARRRAVDRRRAADCGTAEL